jgi:hypothetical protein
VKKPATLAEDQREMLPPITDKKRASAEPGPKTNAVAARKKAGQIVARSAQDRQFDAERAARRMERALFDCKPVLRSVWPVLSEQVRSELFDLHRPDLTPAYRIAVKAATPHYKERPWPHRETPQKGKSI